MAALVLSLSSLMNAAGALFFVVAGVFAWVAAKGALRARLIGATAVTFGVPFILTNLAPADALFVQLVTPLLYVVAIATFLLLAFHLAGNADAAGRRILLAAAAAIFVGVGATAFLLLRDPAPYVSLYFGPSAVVPGIVILISFTLETGALMLVVAACAVRFRGLDPVASSTERRALALLAVALGIYPLFYQAPVYAVLVAQGPVWIGLVLSSFAWLATLRATASRDALFAWLALAGTALAGLVYWGPIQIALHEPASDFGAPGIARTMGAGILAVAIFRHDLLGVRLPAVTVRRGPLAAAGLATLFIVAQLAQNFLSERYSLITGILAGALVFVSGPIQRAFEGRIRGDQVARNEDVYRKALRLALKDRVITREEETHLHELAEALGIGGARAHALLREAELESKR